MELQLQQAQPTPIPIDSSSKASVRVPVPAVMDPPETLLAQYFKELAGMPVLQSKQEFEMSKNLEELEVALWREILSYPLVIEPILNALQPRFERCPKEFAQLRRSVRALRASAHNGARQRFLRWGEQTAHVLRRHDVDRNLRDRILEEIDNLKRKEDRAQSIFGGLRIVASSRTFLAYYQRVRQLARASQQAWNEFVQANLRLVITIARRYNHGQIPFHDLIQEGNIGLIKAVGRFDHRRGFRFSTYASWWIRHAITRAIADKGRLVRVPVHMLSTTHKVDRTNWELSSRLGRAPTHEEICQQTSLSSSTVERVKELSRRQAFSLDRHISREDDHRFVDMIQDVSNPSPADRIGDQQVLAQVNEIFSELLPMEVDILAKRFGLKQGREYTLNELGLRYGLSRERIRQIQEQTLAKIRRSLRRRKSV